jgi:hypothetical protein
MAGNGAARAWAGAVTVNQQVAGRADKGQGHWSNRRQCGVIIIADTAEGQDQGNNWKLCHNLHLAFPCMLCMET